MTRDERETGASGCTAACDRVAELYSDPFCSPLGRQRPHAGAPPSDIGSRPHRACKASREAITSQELSCVCFVSERQGLHAAFELLVFSN